MLDLNYKVENKVALAALLHDIGKLLSRCDNYVKTRALKNAKHQEASVGFLKDLNSANILKLDKEFEELVKRHHESNLIDEEYRVQGIEDTKLENLAYIISRADNYSSSERRDEDDKTSSYKKRPLDCLFSQLYLNTSTEDSSNRYKLTKLSSENIFPMDFKENTQLDLTKLVDEMYRELKNLNTEDFNSFFVTMYHILEKYTWCIPSDTTKTICDISLFDHLKTTSAIALSSYIYHKETGTLNKKEVKDDDCKRFLVLGCEIVGLKDFVQDIRTTKKSAKRLRGRAFLGNLLNESLIYKILKELDLTIANNIFNKGNRAYILVPNTENTKGKLNKLQEKVNRYLYKQFEGELYFSIGSVALSGKELKSFTTILERLEIAIENNRNKTFNNLILEYPVIDCENIEGVCPTCNKYFVSEGEEECNLCVLDQNIGKWLAKTRYIAFYDEEIEFDKKVDILNKGFHVAFFENAEEINKVKSKPFIINNIKSTELLSKYPSAFKFYSSYVPMYEDMESYLKFNKTEQRNIDYSSEIKNFVAISDNAKGVKNLAILQMKIDNIDLLIDIGFLGSKKITQISLEESDEKESIYDYTSISRIATLNRMISAFKENYIFHLFSQKRFIEVQLIKEKIKVDLYNHYVLNSSGDGITIIAPWNEAIFTAEYIQDEFKRFVGNNRDITTSASITLIKNKEPLVTGLKKSEISLKKAQALGGNGIMIFDRFVKWIRFNRVFDLGEFISNNLKNGVYSQSFIYRLLKYTQMLEEYVDSEGQDVYKLQYMSKLNYDIQRNLVPRVAAKLNILNYKSKENLNRITSEEEVKKLVDIYIKGDLFIPSSNDFVYKYMRLVLNYVVRKNRGGEVNV